MFVRLSVLAVVTESYCIPGRDVVQFDSYQVMWGTRCLRFALPVYRSQITSNIEWNFPSKCRQISAKSTRCHTMVSFLEFYRSWPPCSNWGWWFWYVPSVTFPLTNSLEPKSGVLALRGTSKKATTCWNKMRSWCSPHWGLPRKSLLSQKKMRGDNTTQREPFSADMLCFWEKYGFILRAALYDSEIKGSFLPSLLWPSRNPNIHYVKFTSGGRSGLCPSIYTDLPCGQNCHSYAR